MTLLGLGAFPMTDKLALGMLGMHSTGYANHAIMESDLIISVGARFDDGVTGKLDAFAPNAQVIHIDRPRKCFEKRGGRYSHSGRL